MYGCVRMHACLYACMPVGLCACMRIGKHITYIYICVCAHIHACMHAQRSLLPVAMNCWVVFFSLDVKVTGMYRRCIY